MRRIEYSFKRAAAAVGKEEAMLMAYAKASKLLGYTALRAPALRA